MTRPTLRVAFVPLLPSSNAATRAFCERPRDDLSRRGIVSRVFAPSSSRAYLALYRRHQALRRLRAALYWYGIVAPRRLVQLPRILRCDVVFVQRALFRYSSPPVLEAVVALAARLLRRKLVVHCDDALHTVVRPAYYRARFRLADWVVTGNGEVAAYARTCNPNVELIEGAVDARSYPVREHRERGQVVIGWAGHAPTQHLPSIVPALARVCELRPRTVVRVVGDEAFVPAALGRHVVSVPWSPECEFSLFGEFDIGVMPLLDTATNRGKEGYKLKEYMASGLPFVCSPVGHNVRLVDDGVNGFLARSEDEWVAALVRLIDDPSLRERLGAAGRRLVLDRYDAPLYARQLGDFLLRISRETRRVEGLEGTAA